MTTEILLPPHPENTDGEAKQQAKAVVQEFLQMANELPDSSNISGGRKSITVGIDHALVHAASAAVMTSAWFPEVANLIRSIRKSEGYEIIWDPSILTKFLNKQ